VRLWPSRWEPRQRPDLSGVMESASAVPIEHPLRVVRPFGVVRDDDVPAATMRAAQLVPWF
jgi:hypothetical protein